MGNKIIKNEPVILNKNEKEEIKIPDLYFRKFYYKKDYFEIKETDLFYEFLDLDTNLSNYLPKTSIELISNSLLNYENLTGLKLRLRNQNYENLIMILNSMQKITTLKVIDLNISGSKLKEDELIQILNRLIELKYLVELHLDLSMINFYEKNFDKLNELLIINKKEIRELTLNLESINVKNENYYYTLFDTIRLLTNLSCLKISIIDSNISDQGLIILSNSIEELKNLVNISLFLSNNGINDKGFIYLCDVLSKFENKFFLIEFSFPVNNLTITSMFHLINLLKKQRNINEILFHFILNKFNQDQMESPEIRQEFNETINLCHFLTKYISIGVMRLSEENYKNICLRRDKMSFLYELAVHLKKCNLRKEIFFEIINLIKKPEKQVNN